MSNADASSSSLRSLLPQLLLGGTSVIPAIILTHPLDFIKLRQQLHGFKVASSASPSSTSNPRTSTRPVLDAVFRIARDEGVLRLFSGLSPAIVRAYTFSATRLGLYEPIRARVTKIAGAGDEPTFGVKIVSALGSGMLGTLVGNPFELLKVRMQGGDYAYRGVFHGLYTVCRDEGLRTLWNGTPASIIRSSLFSAAQLATYDHTKVTLMKHTRLEPGLQLNFSAAMIAGLVTTTVTTPADFVKSVMMNDAGRRGSDVGMRVIVSKVVRKDGGRSFFRGWLANYARLGPHTVITMLTMEKLRSLIGWDTL